MVSDINLIEFPEENPNPVLRVDDEGYVLYRNKASGPILKSWKFEEGKPISAQWRKIISYAIDKHKPGNFEIKCEDRIFSLTITPVSKEYYANIYGMDITDLKRAFNEIEELSKYPSQNPNPVIRVSHQGMILYHNVASYPILNAWNCVLGNTIPNPWNFYVIDLLKTGKTNQYELFYNEKVYSLSFSPVIEKRCVNIYGLNITELKNVYYDLHEAEKNYYRLFETSSLGLIRTDKNGDVVELNEQCEKIFGASREVLLNFNFHEVKDEEMKYMIQQAFSGTPSSYEGEYTSIAGSRTSYIHMLFLPLYNDLNEFIGLFCSITDITDKIRLEKELMNSQKIESIGLLAGGIAHDFNNFLTAILGSVSIAKLKLSAENEIYELMDDIETASMRAKKLTSQLLTFSKGGSPIKKTQSIVELIKETVAFNLRGTPINFEVNYSPDLWMVNIDKEMIVIVIQNIILNSRQAMNEGGLITINIDNLMFRNADDGKEKRYVRVEINDEGVGIKEEHLNKIFDPYFTTKSNGKGLGLSISYSIIKKHKGDIHVKSKLDEGTSIIIQLPAINQTIKVEDKNVFEMKHFSGTVLIMDDEDSIIRILTSLLRELGLIVVSSKHGEELLEKYSSLKDKTTFDLVILDLTIKGGMGGKETVKKLREIDDSLVIIATSGYSNNPIMSNHKKYGFDDILSKPYDIEDLSRLIEKIIEPDPQIRF